MSAHREGSLSDGTRAAGILRRSLDESRQEYSFDRQQHEIDGYCSRKGYSLAVTFEDNMTGSRLDRPGLMAALTAAEAGEFDVLVVSHLDRLSRDNLVFQMIVARLRAAGVRIESATENVDMETPDGEFVATVLSAMATMYRGQLIANVTAGFAAKARRGLWMGSKPPYGYMKDPAGSKVIQSNPGELPTLRLMFDLCVREHLGGKAIAVRLNDRGLRNRNGNFWGASSVLRRLANPVYVGMIARRGEVFPGQHEGVIDIGIWEAAQRVTRTRSFPSRRNDDVSTYLLAGVMKCGACGATFGGRPGKSRNGSVHRYYTCGRRHKYGNTSCTTEGTIQADALESQVVDLIIETYTRTNLFVDALKESGARAQDDIPTMRDERRAVQRKLTDLERRLDTYFSAFERDQLLRDELQERVEKLRTERLALTASIANLTARLETPVPVGPTLVEMRRLTSHIRSALLDGGSLAAKAVIRALVHEIQVNDPEISVVLRVPIRNGQNVSQLVATKLAVPEKPAEQGHKQPRHAVRTQNRLVAGVVSEFRTS